MKSQLSICKHPILNARMLMAAPTTMRSLLAAAATGPSLSGTSRVDRSSGDYRDISES